mgnify:FL=1|tara:strand:- start:754 stop:969 length:216 start_codon:yes stop_codon:yes gene_type:complete
MGILNRSKSTLVREESLSDTLSNNLVNNSNIVKSSLDVTKKLVSPLTKILDYGVVAIVSVVVYKYLLEPRF